MKRKKTWSYHYCGGGYKGIIKKVRGISFCDFCGHEFRGGKK